MTLSSPTRNVNTVDEKIIIILFSIQEQYGKTYSYPSQEKILLLLKTFYGITICRRTLNYHLRELEGSDFISRKRRIKRLPDGTLSLATSLYFLCKSAYAHLKRLSRFVFNVLKKRPSWAKQFDLGNKIKDIQAIEDETKRHKKYLNVIYDTLA